MNVAGKELCQELYELSEWGKTQFPYHIGDGLQKYFQYADKSNTPYIADGTDYSIKDYEKEGTHIPAYDLGYLLRKLDYKWVKLEHSFEVDEPTNRWTCSFLSDDIYGFVEDADTPEDAACKLAIELFKQGVLSK